MGPVMTTGVSRGVDGRKRALITGASAGIGKAFAEIFAKHGFDVVLVARREERLRALACELTERYDIAARVLPADLANPEAPKRVYDELRADGLTVDALVNNAGYGIPEDYRDSTWQDQARFLQVTGLAVAHFMHLFLPGMIDRGYGRIINVASLAALLPGMAGHTLYSGVKSFLVKTSQSLMIELEGTGVHVTALCPGFTYTEYHDVIRTRKYVSELPTFVWMTAEEVAQQGYAAVMAGKPVYVNGWINGFAACLARILPDWLVMKTARRQVVED